MPKDIKVSLIVMALCVMALITIHRFAPASQPPPDCDDVCTAMKYIEAGRDVPFFVHFPIYMSRFDMKVVEVTDHYQSQLPRNIYLGKTAVLINDSVTGYKWLENSSSDRYKVL